MFDWFLSLPKIRQKRSYRDDVQRGQNLKDYFGNLAPDRITPTTIEEYIENRLHTKSRKGTYLTPATINREIALLKTCYNKAEKDRKTHDNPTKAVSKLKGEVSRDRTLSAEEWGNYYNAAEKWYKPIALAFYTTGMRANELRTLTSDCVNKKTGFIHLKAEFCKNGEARKVPINPELMDTLNRIPRSLSGYVFTKDGEPLKALRWWHEQTCKRAEIEDFHIHDFRHCCVTNWRRQGHDISTIMKAVGHKSISMFARYNSVTDDDLQGLVSDSQQMVNGGNQNG